MGFYLRKSTKIGPFRVNLSKSGVGVSAGVPGFRVSTGPRGAMVHMGRSGIYYQKSLGKSRHQLDIHGSKPGIQPKHGTQGVDNLIEIDSNAVGTIVDANSKDVVALITSARQRFRLTWLTLPIIVGAFALPVLWLVVITSFLVFVLADKKRCTAYLAYSIDETLENRLQQFYDALKQALGCQKLWHISAEGATGNWKTSGGANLSVRRNQIKVSWGFPKGIKTNVLVPGVPVGRQVIYFLPDMVLITEKRDVGAVSYVNLQIEESLVDFLEEETPPTDGEQVGITWKYVNKNGGPDKRFKDNYQIPIYRYNQVHFRSTTGLNEVLQLSDPGQLNVLTAAVQAVGHELGKLPSESPDESA